MRSRSISIVYGGNCGKVNTFLKINTFYLHVHNLNLTNDRTYFVLNTHAFTM